MNNKQFSLRIDEETLTKLRLLCKSEKRSVNAQILYMIRQSISRFEKENGKIEIEE